MRCKTCEYRLWNLRERRCPECGTEFVPSEFEFVPNSVRFRCPHCDQDYYGTSEQGHLIPIEFDCVSCGRHIHMDEMILFPTEGVKEEQTKIEHHPWSERAERGRIRAWFSSVGMAFASPTQAMRTLPDEHSGTQAWWFAIISIMITATLGILPLALLGAGMVVAFGGAFGGVGVITMMSAGFAIFLAGSVAVVLLWIVIWGFTAHVLLMLLAKPTGSIQRTYDALIYSYGTNVLAVIPYLGPLIGSSWWIISSTMMLAERQTVGKGRAAVATVTAPGLLFVGLVGLLVAWIINIGPMLGSAMSIGAEFETSAVTRAVITYSQLNKQTMPEHAGLLVTDNLLTGVELVTSNSNTFEEDIPVGNTTLDLLRLQSAQTAQQNVQAAIEALSDDVIAYRLGDYVFTHHGIDPATGDPKLWIVVQTPAPSFNQPLAPSDCITVGHLDGSTSQFTANLLTTELADQNKLRAQQGLPPLPDPTTVTHSQPAVAPYNGTPPLAETQTSP